MKKFLAGFALFLASFSANAQFYGNAYPYLCPPDSVAQPCFNWALNVQTGMYQPAIGQIGFAINGVNVGTFTSSGLSGITIVAPLMVGTAGADNLITLGGQSPANVVIGTDFNNRFGTSAVSIVGLNNVAPWFTIRPGTGSVPGNAGIRIYNGNDGLNVGAAEFRVNNLGTQFIISPSTFGTGTVVADFRSTYVTNVFDNILRAGDGTTGSPTYSFINDTGIGFYRALSGDIRFAMGAADKVRFIANELILAQLHSLSWASSGIASTDVHLSRAGVGALALTSGATPMSFMIYNTTDGGANFERFDVRWSSNIAFIETAAGGTGSNRGMRLSTGGGSNIILDLPHVASAVNYIEMDAAVAGAYPAIFANGTDTNAGLILSSKAGGNGYVGIRTGNVDQFRVAHTASAVNYVQVTGGPASGTEPSIQTLGSDPNIGFVYSTKGTSAHRFFTNTGSQEQFRIAHTPSAINLIQATGAATGNGPFLQAIGADSNIDFKYYTTGTGGHKFYTNNSPLQLQIAHVASAVNYAVFQGGATGNGVTFGAGGTDTNVPIYLNTQGTGEIRFRTNTGAQEQFRVAHTASATNYIQVTGSNGGAPEMTTSAAGLNLVSGPSSNLLLRTQDADTTRRTQVQISQIASADRFLTLAGANGGNPTISTSAGSLAITPAVVMANNLTLSGTFTATSTSSVSHSIAGSSDSNSLIAIGNGTTFTTGSGTQYVMQFIGGLQPAANQSAFVIASSSAIARAGSGTHPDFAWLYLNPSVGPGSATITNATTLKINAAPSVGTNQRALWVVAGVTETLNHRLTGFTFANIATNIPNNGDIGYCSDCTIANPCAGAGTGALAKRLNGVNVCN